MLNNYDNNLKYGISLKNNFYTVFISIVLLNLTTTILAMEKNEAIFSSDAIIMTKKLCSQPPCKTQGVYDCLLQSRLYNAIEKKDNNKILFLLKNGAKPNGYYTNNTPLTLAISIGALDCVKLLLKNGSSPRVFTINDGNKYYPEDELDWECQSPSEEYIFVPGLSKKDNYAIHAALLKARLKQLQKETTPI